MIDTLEYSKQLERAGFTREQAEAQSRALYAAMTESVATRENLELTEQRLSARIDGTEQKAAARSDSLESKLSARIDTLAVEVKHLRWAMGLVIGSQIAILVKLFV